MIRHVHYYGHYYSRIQQPSHHTASALVLVSYRLTLYTRNTNANS